MKIELFGSGAESSPRGSVLRPRCRHWRIDLDFTIKAPPRFFWRDKPAALCGVVQDVAVKPRRCVRLVPCVVPAHQEPHLPAG